MVLAFLITFLASIFLIIIHVMDWYIYKNIQHFFRREFQFCLTSFLGFFVLIGLIKENKYNLYLILIVFILFSNNYMCKKYLEPLWLILFFLVMNSKIFSDFIKSQKQIFSFELLYFILRCSNIE